MNFYNSMITVLDSMAQIVHPLVRGGKGKMAPLLPVPRSYEGMEPRSRQREALTQREERMACVQQDKEDGRAAGLPCPTSPPPPPTLPDSSGDGVYIVKPGYCQAQFSVTFIFQ